MRGTVSVVDNPSLRAEVLEAVGPRLRTFWSLAKDARDLVVLETAIEEATRYLPMEGRKSMVRFHRDGGVSMTEPRELLRQMLLIRRFEEKAAQMYGLRKIGGFCHLYIGQEAVAVGSIAALELARDYVVTAYRDHGHALACGMDPEAG